VQVFSPIMLLQGDDKQQAGNEQQINNLYLDEWLTVHRSITFVDLQLDAQNSCLFTYNTFIRILYTFRALPCSSSGALRRNCLYFRQLTFTE
jgi:hypothetical protein